MRQDSAQPILENDAFRVDELGPHVRVRQEIPARDVTTFALGGPLSLFVEPCSIDGLQQTLQTFSKRGISFRILGAGSNIIIDDVGLREPVIRFSRELSGVVSLHDRAVDLKTLETERQQAATEKSISLSPRVFAFSGCSLMGLSRKTTQEGLSGLEFAAGIPGSLGGAVRMNAGAHGEAISSIVRNVVLLEPTGLIRFATHRELDFSYRHSNIPNDMVILGVELELQFGDRGVILERRNSCLEYRKKTQPLHLPSAGSVFRNPIGEGLPAAAMLIEQVGLKGVVRGGVQFSELHANWLVKRNDDARASDARALIAEAQAAVRERFSIELEPEIILW